MSKKVYGCVMGVLAVFLLCGTFFDLQISQVVYNPDNLFGKFFYGFGQVPAMLTVSFGFMLLSAVRDKGKKLLSVVIILVLGVASLYYAVLPFLIAGYFLEWGTVGRAAMMIFAILVFAGMELGAKKIAEVNERGILIRTSLTLILMFFGVGRICGILKNIWGRPRFYSMLDDFSRFSPWYRIAGTPLDDTFKSFPSGHAADACMILSIVLLAGLVPKLHKKAKFLYAAALVWIVCVMLARIIAGAHFLSDVSVGAALTCTVFFVLTKLLLRDTSRKPLSDEAVCIQKSV
ncbi:phosphatase PAP2 family protein [Faecalicatena orotica]|uniref:PAP2 superfamily protein n=1 Tax=Faecalicatena orotica TaxID=1544 RepID=A0A2Y9BMW3_9FIRM|nr:phosphatase PAP2 family protein [Faecalicatena orotica]PWJ21527.1 PAP2 superfamily protein [Faecalicatena orotica]SSA58337.1 PAP2 superfamily protein [Faecalicatena orotica]